MIGILGEFCSVRLGTDDVEAGLVVDERGEGSIHFRNKEISDLDESSASISFVNTQQIDKFISMLEDLKNKMNIVR